MKFNTSLLHNSKFNGEDKGATLPPLYQVSAFACESAEQLEKVFNNKAAGFSYTRVGNPTVSAFENRIAALEGGIGAVACSSGMAAITAVLLNILRSGDEVIVSTGLFGGTIDLFNDLKAFGITAHFLEAITYDTVTAAANENTKAVFTELIGNPKLDVVDLDSVSKACSEKRIPLIVDSTTVTPYIINPLKHGADIVVHSSSKYINGSGNSISGIIVDSGRFKWDTERYPGFENYVKFGPFAFLSKLRNGLWRNTGGCLSPFNAYMNIVGLETLGLRMERCCDNALKLAEFFESLDNIQVNYPALTSSPYYELVQRELSGKGGAIVTIRAGSKEKAFKLMDSIEFASVATNIGDVRTLVIHPASTIYTHNTEQQRISAGVYDDTIRISVGIEDIDDLIEDFRQATERL
ncbi:MAG: PLP-dependent transferase [Ruminococcus sp.]|uniref:O-acetylhomoserine aminocarboxypropyltransferase/cysteine synthase family protein n=1 Tax=Ruminococcus sp. TaxID=41978 RepID=UPI0025CF2FE4|nr:PLP-dependent transferase [Ruminococcus sp.]MCR5600999.1 PLP-dependent transferase [Ruminococcus sp.]